MATPEPVSKEDRCYLGDCSEEGIWLVSGLMYVPASDQSEVVSGLFCSVHLSEAVLSLEEPDVASSVEDGALPSETLAAHIEAAQFLSIVGGIT